MTVLEADVLMYLRCWFLSGVPAATGPVPVSRETLAALRRERGLADDAPVALVVPRARGVLSVPLVEAKP